MDFSLSCDLGRPSELSVFSLVKDQEWSPCPAWERVALLK